MNNIIEYIKEYGNISFQKKGFNEVDGGIFSILSYVDFTGIISADREYIKLSEALELFFTTGIPLPHCRCKDSHIALGGVSVGYFR